MILNYDIGPSTDKIVKFIIDKKVVQENFNIFF